MVMRKVGKKGQVGKWGLPGGSRDSKDADDLATAEREAKEEVGAIPAHEVKGHILIKRCSSLPTLLFPARIKADVHLGVSIEC